MEYKKKNREILIVLNELTLADNNEQKKRKSEKKNKVKGINK